MIAIAVTYYFVAKECGVRCKMIQFRNFFFLEWLDTTNDPLPQIYSIDIHTGELRQKRRYPIGGGRQSVRYCPKMFLPFIIELFERKLGITRCRYVCVYVSVLKNRFLFLCSVFSTFIWVATSF